MLTNLFFFKNVCRNLSNGLSASHSIYVRQFFQGFSRHPSEDFSRNFQEFFQKYLGSPTRMPLGFYQETLFKSTIFPEVILRIPQELKVELNYTGKWLIREVSLSGFFENLFQDFCLEIFWGLFREFFKKSWKLSSHEEICWRFLLKI